MGADELIIKVSGLAEDLASAISDLHDALQGTDRANDLFDFLGAFELPDLIEWTEAHWPETDDDDDEEVQR